MNLNILIGLIYAGLGLTGLVVIIFATSPVVTLPFQALGFAGFISLFSYSLYRAVVADLANV